MWDWAAEPPALVITLLLDFWGRDGLTRRWPAFETLKDKGAFAILLELPAGKEVTATTKGTKQTDVHLFVYDADKKEVGKDTSPGPICEVKFTPK